MELIFQVKNQRLYLNTVNKVVADSKNYLTAAFSFTDDWDGAVKTAQFTKGTTTTNVVLDSTTNTCTVPQAVLSGEGEFYVSVFGSKENGATIITANTIKIEVLPSGFIANPGTISEADAAALQAHADAVTAVTNNSTLSAGGYVHQILFTVRNQSMYLTTRGKIVADSQGYLGAKFLFTDDWDGMIKIAQFKRGGLFYNIRLDENNECTVPWEVLVDEGIFIANVFGNNPQNSANRIITVNPVEVHVEKSGLTEGELPSNPTLGLDGQVLFEIYQYAESAAAAASAAATSATSSQRYATDAGEYASDANTAAGTAESAATSAAASAASAATDAAAAANMITEVSNLKTEITALSATVNEAVENMDTYQQSAADNAALAEKWATYTDGTVDGNEFSAKYYAGVSGTQATAASTSATAAATSATAAAASATSAADSADDAETYKNNAASSATSASESATSASESATTAGTAATNAGSSATAAAQSATAAANSATSAGTSAVAASQSATDAATSESNASDYASDAADSASAAATSASNAADSASAASTSASAAASSATAAAASATTASNAAQTVENYASGFTPLTSPAFDGIPTAPTAMAGTNTDQIATTAYVQAELEDYATLNDLDDYVELTSSGYIKSASVSGDTLTLTKGNDTTITYTPDIPTKVSDLTNDAGYATTTYTNTAIADAVAGLVDSAPATLDTLNELANALGDDPNFATTIATQIGAKADASDLDDYLPLAGGTLTGNVYTTPYYDSTIVDPEGGQTLIVSKGKVAKGTAPSNDEWHTMVMAVDNSGSTNNANKYGQVETAVKTDGSVETVLQTYKNEANSTTSAKISVGYDANGKAFTSAPTPTAGDNSTKIATTAFVRQNALPLSGGTLTGNITFNKTNPDIIGARTTGRVGLFAGANNFDGAGLQLFGREDSTYAGMFYLRASTKSSSSDSGGAVFDLVGRPNGLLTWNSKEVITAAGGTMSAGLNMDSHALNLGASSNDDGRIYNISNLLRLVGGSNTSTGSYIDIGSSSATVKGIVLAASDGNGTTKQLKAVYDGTLTWDGNAVALSKDVLALSGGTLTGNVTANKQFFELTNSTLNGRNSIFGGTSGNNGAFLFVYGKDHTSLAGNFVLHANDGTNTSELVGKPDGTLTWGGLDIAPQKWASATFADKSVASGTRTNLGSYTLTKGTWLICIAVNFPSNANGYRDINISSSSAGSQLDRYRYYRCAPTNGSDTHIIWTIFDSASANITRYVNVLQNSGSALNVGGGYIAFRLSNNV